MRRVVGGGAGAPGGAGERAMSGEDEQGDKPRRRRRVSGRASDEAERTSGRDAGLAVRVKTAKGRKLASTQWLRRQLNDPYVRRAQAEGYRSRSAFKLLELDEKCRLLTRGAVVADLGAAPGGWCQAALKRGAAQVAGVDLLAMDPIAGAELIEGDFTDPDVAAAVAAALGGPADLVLSDMAANTTGHRETDHWRTAALVEAALIFAQENLKPGGAFVAKTFQGGAGAGLVAEAKRSFSRVRHVKPPASRAESPETYLVAQGFRRVEGPQRSDVTPSL